MINSSILSIIVCFIPAIIIGLILYYFDSDKSKKKLLLLALSFAVGAFMFYIAYRLDMHFGTYFKGFIATSYFKSFLYALFGVAIFEESCKFIGTLVFIFKYKIKNIYNSIVLSSFVALGFSMAEPSTVILLETSGIPVRTYFAMKETEVMFSTTQPASAGIFPTGTARLVQALMSTFSAPCG